MWSCDFLSTSVYSLAVHCKEVFFSPCLDTCLFIYISISVVQLPSCVWVFAIHGMQYSRLPCPSLSLRVCWDLCPLSQWCHPAILYFHSLLLLPSIFPSIRVFSNESVLRIRGPKYWSFSFSISPSNEYSGWFPLRLTGLILLSKGLSRVFSSTTIGKQLILQCSAFFMVQLSHDYWKNHSFDYTEFVLYNTWICFIWWIIILRNNYLFSCSNCPKMG